MRLASRIVTTTTALLALGASVPALAVPLTADGAWQTFDVDALTSASGGVEWVDLADGTPLSFSFDIAAGRHGVLTIVDAGFAGDRFSVLDGGRALAPTSVATDSAPDSVSTDFDAALADARYSRGVYGLAAGHHEISGALLRSALFDGVALDATVGAIRLSVSPIPEPATWAGLLAGLGLMAFVARRRRV